MLGHIDQLLLVKFIILKRCNIVGVSDSEFQMKRVLDLFRLVLVMFLLILDQVLGHISVNL